MLSVLLALSLSAAASPPAAVQLARDAQCAKWQDCRELALAAADRGEYESFHDLAWRAVQIGPPKDPALLYLLARAQSLSGRPHDALIMLERLAEMGVTSDVATNDDFSRARQLPGWPDVLARIEQANGADSSTPAAAAKAAARTVAPSPARSPSSATASIPRAYGVAPAPVAEALRFSTERLAVGGLAYDGVSQRFLLGDRHGRRVMVVSEGSHEAIGLVSGESAGFHEVSAIEIDAKRGDLWVASGAAGDGDGALHRLQLVSGRPLKTFRVSTELEPVSLVDLAVGAAGGVFVLDSVGRQLLALRAGGTSLERVVRIDAPDPKSVAVGDEERIAYVAHQDGVSRVDLRARTTTLITAPKGVSLAGLERIRWYRGGLIAVEAGADGSRRIIHLELNAAGRAVARATILETSVAVGDPTFVISGDDVVYLVNGSSKDGRPVRDAASDPSEFVAYRVRIP